MEGGIPMLNCLLQHTLRSLCSCSDSSNSPNKWVYAVFWRILPRNYPPPKLEYGEGVLDRSKRNKRNWILVWEDGFCDFYECERAAANGYIKGRFGADVFFKMSHEVYSYGEGLVGKVAAENSHKWIFRNNTNENDPNFISSWNVSIDPQPRTWDFQFNSGIQTITIISVREGIIQLGSFDKITEDLNMVINIQRKFIYLQSIPGIFTIQRPHLPFKISKYNDEKPQITGAKKRFHDDHHINRGDKEAPLKSINVGWNSPQNGLIGPPFWPIPPLFPTMQTSLGALLSKLPSVLPAYNPILTHDLAPNYTENESPKMKINEDDEIKLETSCLRNPEEHDEKLESENPNLWEDEGAERKMF